MQWPGAFCFDAVMYTKLSLNLSLILALTCCFMLLNLSLMNLLQNFYIDMKSVAESKSIEESVTKSNWCEILSVYYGYQYIDSVFK